MFEEKEKFANMFRFKPEERKFYFILVASSWLSNIGHGLAITVLGPTQPYLARNVGVGVDLINLVWTFGFLGYVVGSLIAGMVFKR
jgi:MFS family permease